MEHQYSWSVDENHVMTVWENNTVLATLEDCFDTSLEELFADVVYELRGVDLNAEK